VLPGLFIAILLLGAPLVARAAVQPPLFATGSEARRACPNDIVVWVNTRTRYYHYKGQPWYGKTSMGAYVCKAEADQAGDLPGDLPIPGQL